MNNSGDRLASLAEWRAHWGVVFAAMAGMTISAMHTYSLGVMIAPLEAEFSWTRAQITSGLFISSILAVPFAPFMGMAIDRVGPRRIGLIGVSLYCFSICMLSLANEQIWTWWLLWGILTVAILHIKPTVWVTAVSGLFSYSRGLALAVVLASTGICSFLTPIVSFYLVEKVGWRSAYIFMGAGGAVLTLPLLYFFFSGLKDKQRTAANCNANPVPVELPGLTFGEGLRSSTFYKLGGAVFIMTLAGVSLSVNTVPILTFTGLARENAAAVAGLVGISQIVGRLAGGYLLDRFNARIVAGVSVTLPAITCLILISLPGSLAAAVFAVIVLGLAAGAEVDAIAYLSGRYFGMRNFGTLFGTLSGIMTLAVGLGPIVASHIYDVTQSYNPVLWGAIPLMFISSFLFLTTGPYPCFEKEEMAESNGSNAQPEVM